MLLLIWISLPLCCQSAGSIGLNPKSCPSETERAGSATPAQDHRWDRNPIPGYGARLVLRRSLSKQVRSAEWFLMSFHVLLYSVTAAHRPARLLRLVTTALRSVLATGFHLVSQLLLRADGPLTACAATTIDHGGYCIPAFTICPKQGHSSVRCRTFGSGFLSPHTRYPLLQRLQLRSELADARTGVIYRDGLSTVEC